MPTYVCIMHTHLVKKLCLTFTDIVVHVYITHKRYEYNMIFIYIIFSVCITTCCTLYDIAPFILILFHYSVTQFSYVYIFTMVYFSISQMDHPVYSSNQNNIIEMICASSNLCCDAIILIYLTRISTIWEII